MNLLLLRGKDHSSIVLTDDNKDIDQLNYNRKIHKYESDGDFSTLKTELATYGYKAMLEVWNHFKATRT